MRMTVTLKVDPHVLAATVIPTYLSNSPVGWSRVPNTEDEVNCLLNLDEKDESVGVAIARILAGIYAEKLFRGSGCYVKDVFVT